MRSCSHLVFAVAIALGGCSKSAPPKPAATEQPKKDPAAAKQLIASGATVLDVRTPEEYADGHVPNAVNIPVQELAARIPDVDKLVGGDRSRAVVVYCAAGARAAKAKTQLETVGYSHVVNGGGLDDLQ